jgi:predicted transcriptional regulator of viral defense system
MASPDHAQLYHIAERSAGYFTAAQAEEAGFSPALLSHHVRGRRLERVARGVYRLRHFPASPREDLHVAHLRAGPSSAISHESALALYDLSDILPSEVHVTVPRTASRRRAGIRQHTNRISEDELTSREGLPVTTVGRTLADVARSGLSEDRVRQAMEEAVQRGLVSPEELRDIAAALGGRTARIVGRYLRETGV